MYCISIFVKWNTIFYYIFWCLCSQNDNSVVLKYQNIGMKSVKLFDFLFQIMIKIESEKNQLFPELLALTKNIVKPVALLLLVLFLRQRIPFPEYPVSHSHLFSWGLYTALREQRWHFPPNKAKVPSTH